MHYLPLGVGLLKPGGFLGDLHRGFFMVDKTNIENILHTVDFPEFLLQLIGGKHPIIGLRSWVSSRSEQEDILRETVDFFHRARHLSLTENLWGKPAKVCWIKIQISIYCNVYIYIYTLDIL